MAGGLEIVGLLALLAGACELVSRLFPRRLVDEFRDAFGDVPSSPVGGPIHSNRGPLDETAVQPLRDRGAL